MTHYLLAALLAYLATGVVITELLLFVERRATGQRATVRQYCNLCFFYPVVIYVAQRSRKIDD